MGRELRWPVVSKDAIKERLFDFFGPGTRERSRQLGRASVEILFAQVEALLQAGGSQIVDSPLRPEHEDARVTRLQQTYGCSAVQIILTGQKAALYGRYRARAFSPDRHHGHREQEFLDEIEDRLGSLHPALHVPTELIAVDTTDFSKVNYGEILGRVRATAGLD